MAVLKAERFQGIADLEQMINGARMTVDGFDSNGDLVVDRPNDPVAVAALQQALRDLNYELEVHGSYDSWTAEVVRRFKHDQSLTTPGAITDDGVAGRGTMGRLDELFSGQPDVEPEPIPDEVNPVGGDFRIKLMEGVSASLGVGLFQYTFVIWDPARAEAGVFVYEGAIGGEGIGSPFESESDWVDFSLGPTIHVDFLSGNASHRKTNAGLGELFTLEVTPDHAPSFVVQFTGLALGIGLEFGSGTFTLDSAGVRPFNG